MSFIISDFIVKGKALIFFYFPCSQMFKKSGISKHALREISVAEPFTSAQDNRVANVINEGLFADKDEFNGEVSA